MTLSLIYASARNGVIGRDGKLPWRLSEDLRRFKRLTTGGVVVMGRRTWESIGSKQLPGRMNIVISRTMPWSFSPGHSTLDTRIGMDRTLRWIAGAFSSRPVFVIGGAGIFAQALPSVHRIHWTRIDADVDGDTIFDFRPDRDDGWKMVASKDVPADAENEYKSTYMIFNRK